MTKHTEQNDVAKPIVYLLDMAEALWSKLWLQQCIF